MVQDYAKSAKRHREKLKKKPKKTVSPVKVTLIVVVVIAFGAFLFYLTQLQTDPALLETEIPGTQSPAEVEVEQPALEPEQTSDDESYDFYRLLPESEVVPPDVEAYSFKEKNAEGATRYLIQAGSFRNAEDADRLRAKLILEGLDVTVTPVRSQQGQLWHRVIVGPFTDRSALNKAEDTLANANTEFLTLEIKDD